MLQIKLLNVTILGQTKSENIDQKITTAGEELLVNVMFQI